MHFQPLVGRVPRSPGRLVAGCALSLFLGVCSTPVLGQADLVRPAEYQIGPSDVLKITVWNGLELLEQSITVAQDGTLFLPFGVNKTIAVAGVTVGALKQQLRDRLSGLYRALEIQVVVEQLNSQKAYLLGEVPSPGAYGLESDKRLLEFIIEQGGVGRTADLRRVQVNHATGEKDTVDLGSILVSGDRTANLRLQSGDVVWVPSLAVGQKTYFIFGEARAPGIVNADVDLTLREAIAQAGGPTSDASLSNVFVVRGGLQNPQILMADLKALLEEADFTQDLSLQDRDLIWLSRSRTAKFRDFFAVINPALRVVLDAILVKEVFD